MGAEVCHIDDGNLVIRSATSAEVNVVLTILTEAAVWQAAEREPVCLIPFP